MSQEDKEIALIREAARDTSLSDGAVRAIALGLQEPTADDIEWAKAVSESSCQSKLAQDLRKEADLCGPKSPRGHDLRRWADAVAELEQERDGLRIYYAGDCHICHHDPRLSPICSRCGQECLQCQVAREQLAHQELRAAMQAQIDKLLKTALGTEATLARVRVERDQWEAVATDFHNALVGAGNAGGFNHRLCEQAVRLFDVLCAKEGKGHPEDVADIRTQILGAEVTLARVRTLVEELRAEAATEDTEGEYFLGYAADKLETAIKDSQS